MALRPSPGVLDRRAQRTARRIPARLQRGAAAPRARPANPRRSVPRQGQGPARPRTRSPHAGQTRRGTSSRTAASHPIRIHARETRSQGRADRANARGRHHRPQGPQDRQTRLHHAGQHRRHAPCLQRRQAQRRAAWPACSSTTAGPSPPTWRPARSSPTRHSTPPANTNTASQRTVSTMPHDRCKACPKRCVNYAPRHHSLAVDLLGDLTLKVTAAKRRRGDLHIGLRRRLIRRI